MPKNSGSPSAPLNLAIERASGEYIVFLDDDTLIAENLMTMIDYATENDIDFLNGYLIVLDENFNKTIANRLDVIPSTNEETIKSFITHCSLGVTMIVKRTLITDNEVYFDTNLRIGEDLLFCVKLLSCSKNSRYMDKSFYYYNRSGNNITNTSSMQRCGDLELRHRLAALKQIQEILRDIGLDYYKLRVHVPVRDTLLSIVKYSDGISREVFEEFSRFIESIHSYIKDKVYISYRYQQIYSAIYENDYEKYCEVSRLRLLIVGYDLKFILPILTYLEHDYAIKVDEWTAHDVHDKKKSEDLLEWADIIWCEWLLGNAVYYSENKTPNQRVVVRTHRFEIDRDFGNKVNF